MGRRKRSSREYSPFDQSEYYLKMETDIQALRGKNKMMAQSVAKLQQEKAALHKQNTHLQEEYFTLNSKYVNLKNIFSNIESTTKNLCVPKIAETVNHIAKIMQLCALGSAVSGLNKDPKTLTVKPHTVNGTVIKNPVITLSRFNDLESSGSASINSCTLNAASTDTSMRRPSGNQQENSRSSSGRSPEENQIQNSPNSSLNNPLSDNVMRRRRRNQDFISDYASDTNNSFDDVTNNGLNPAQNNCPDYSSLDGQSRSRGSNESEHSSMVDFATEYHKRNVLSALLNHPTEEEEEDGELDNSSNADPEEEDDQLAEEHVDNNDEDYCQRLMTIEEVDEHDTSMQPPLPVMEHVREIRIYLSPLRSEYMNNREDKSEQSILESPSSKSLAGSPSSQSFVGSPSSLSGEASNSILDINNTILNCSPDPSRFGNSTMEHFSFLSSSRSSDFFSKDRPDLSRIEVRKSSPKVKKDVNRISNRHSISSIPENEDDSNLEQTIVSVLEEQTSTPVMVPPSKSVRLTRGNRGSKLSVQISSPVSSHISKRKSSGEKMAQVLIKRMNLSTSTSPMQTISDSLDAVPITDAKQIKRKNNKGSTKSTKKVTVEEDIDEKQNSKDSVKKKTKGKENRKLSIPSMQMPRASPRPKRASRPIQLKEPSLIKKLRRSR